MNTVNDSGANDRGDDSPGGHGPVDLLAGEYVLGVLDADTRREVERRMLADSQLADAVAAWSDRLAPLADDIAAVEPPKELWMRIRNAIAAPATTNTAGRVSAGQRAVRWWDSVIAWRWIGGGAFAAAACCLLLLFVTGRTVQPQTQPAGYMVSTLTSDNGTSGYVATIDLPNARIVLVPIAKNEAPSRVPELWMIAPGEKPLSLGVIQANHTTTISVSAAVIKKMGPQDLLAISLEPPGGSPTGQPTGPVVAKGGISGA
jgi:anti-sigma-K factor RskA